MMFTESDLSVEKNWLYKNLANKAIASLVKNNFQASYVANSQEALETTLKMIPENSTVGISDSVTLHQIGLFTHILDNPKYKAIYFHSRRNEDGTPYYTSEEQYEIARMALTADIYFSGTNSITLDGKLVNIDGFGNRVAAMIFGPKKVIVVAGANKIVKNVEEGLNRIKQYCAPANVKRHVEKHSRSHLTSLPCYKSGICADCALPQRICCTTVIIERAGVSRTFRPAGADSPPLAEINVVIIGESLGM